MRYAARLDLVAASLAEAKRRYEAPLADRAELRGLTEAYAAKAAAAGLAEDPQLSESFAAVRAMLWRAPCDLAAARPLVDTYVRLVQQRMGRTTPSVRGDRVAGIERDTA